MKINDNILDLSKPPKEIHPQKKFGYLLYLIHDYVLHSII